RTPTTATVHFVHTGTPHHTRCASACTAAGRTATLSGITGDGALAIAIDAGSASDTVGNLAAAAGPSATFVVDNTPPTIAIGQPLDRKSAVEGKSVALGGFDIHFDDTQTTAGQRHPG